jgi:predicted GNAT family N-acyltransferase|tara:strand:+ start:204 stop:638 length:435 start_codon:yes stop_codon:yes gene_type:complete
LEELVVKLAEREEDLEAAIALRFQVFVGEQAIAAEEELDEADATATHAVALHHGQVVGTGRFVGVDTTTVRIGRMAVDAAWRRQGIGGRILEFLEGTARAQGAHLGVLHAQEYVKEFYAGRGYREHGETFLEVNIPHVEMRKTL